MATTKDVSIHARNLATNIFANREFLYTLKGSAFNVQNKNTFQMGIVHFQSRRHAFLEN